MGARKTNSGVENVYDAAQEWVNKALRADDSLFTPGRAIWTLDKLRELHALQQQEPDPSLSGFFGKLEKTLEGSPPEVCQLAAEILYFQYLLHYGMTQKGKEGRIKRVLEWSGQQISIPEELAVGLTPGIAKVGPAMGAGLPNYFGFLIEFVERWKEESTDEQHRLLDDPWQFKHFSRDENLAVELFKPFLHTVQRHGLLHLVFPDTFEGTVSDNHKSKLVQRLADDQNEDDDVDRRIQAIRQGIEAELGRDFDFYDEDILKRWDPFEQGFGPPYGPPTKPIAPPLDELASELLWEPDRLKMVIHGLEDKGQVIFQGPPGTGKTYVARRIAQWYREQGGDYQIVQFHPSYTYEDFVGGFRPARAGDGQVGFDLVKGPLRLVAEQARDNPDATFVLVIDEINRGNVAKVLGELYFLLEYRDEAVNLQYSREPFQLPKNLWFIGTMNTTDRSIALVDAALRRRFYFFGLYPDEPPVAGLLRRWLERKNIDAPWVADLVDAANRKLNDRHLGIGPSHFMKQDPPLDAARVRFIWEQAVIPYIEEQCFGDEARLKEFGYDQLIRELGHSAVVPNGDDDQPEGATAGGAVAPADGSDDATS